MCKVYTEKSFQKLLKANGYYPIKNTSGTDHDKWENKEGNRITIPAGKKELNPMLTEGLIKRNRLDKTLI